jgi:hypothetical protein
VRIKATREKHGFNRSTDPVHIKGYIAWKSMRHRCYNPRHPQYKDWGGRGIAICERWASFVAFIEDVGWPTDRSLMLERIDNDGNYEPGNVCWAPQQAQNRNQRQTKLSPALAAQVRAARASGLTLTQVGRQFGISRHHVVAVAAGRRWT